MAFVLNLEGYLCDVSLQFKSKKENLPQYLEKNRNLITKLRVSHVNSYNEYAHPIFKNV